MNETTTDTTIDTAMNPVINHRRMSKTMYNLAAAYFILHVDINLFVVNILPDWLSYIFILNALPIIGELEPSAKLLRPLCLILIVWELFRWVAPMFGITETSQLLSLIILIVQLYLHFQLLTNLANIALYYQRMAAQKNLLIYCAVRTVIATQLYIMMPWMEDSLLIGIGMMVVYLLIGLFIGRELYCLSKEIEQFER